MRSNTLAGIAMTMLLLALPAAASDYTLEIFGNANEDETINMQDVTYTELIILEYRDRTDLADSKYDGKINMQDVTQIELIILGRELELTIIDEGDRIVTVDKPVEKVVLSNPEVIKLLKAEGRVVGVGTSLHKKKVFFPELSKLPGVINHYTLDYEKIYELEPDVLFIYAPSSSKYVSQFDELVEKLDVAGIKVLCLSAYKPEYLAENVEKIGYVLGTREEAEEFVEWYVGQMNTIRDRVDGISEEDKPRVYYEYFADYKGCASGPGVCDQMTMAGGINIASGLYPPKYPVIDPEWVAVQNPDIIVHMTYSGYVPCGYGVDDPAAIMEKRETIMNRPELAEVNAVKDGQIYVYAYDIGESLRHFVGIAYMAKWFHPELFEDIDPQAIHQEYLTEFQGLDYDLDEHGVFVYPDERV